MTPPDFDDMPRVVAPRYQRGLHVYCVFLALSVLGLIAAGGTVTSTGSGLSVPDWPTSYGHNMFTFPPSKWTGGIFYEHTHRLIASTVGLLTIGAAVWMRLRESRRWLRRLSYLALVLVIVQGILGGLTVKFLLPTSISVLHGCLAQAFLCVVTAIAVFTSRRWVEGASTTTSRGLQPARQFESVRRVSLEQSFTDHPFLPTSRLAIACVAVVFFQLLIGAIMRHTGSGLAVPDFPLAYGHILPSLSADSIAAFNDSRIWDHQLPAIERYQIVWHLLHRGGAVIVAITLLTTIALVRSRHRRLSPLTRPANGLFALLIVQIALGALTIWSRRHPFLATAHVAVGAATLATCLLLAIWSRRLLRITAVPPIYPRNVAANPSAVAGVQA